jgi:hypothetical protein
MLTTTDNPYNPFTQFDEWRVFDERMGYHTLSFLARIVKDSNDLSESDQSAAIESAINEVVELNVLGVWRKVTEDGTIVVADTTL